MIKNDKIQIRMSKAQKLVLSMYCKDSKLSLATLYDNALKEYFINHNQLNIFSLIYLADSFLIHNDDVEHVESIIRSNPDYSNILKSE